MRREAKILWSTNGYTKLSVYILQTGMISPSNLRMKLIDSNNPKKKGGSNNNSSRTSPVRVEDMNSLLQAGLKKIQV